MILRYFLTFAILVFSLPATAEAPADRARLRTAHGVASPARLESQRVVSLAPVTTEMVFLLGEGDRLVGVTRFCDRPAAATTKPIVGGLTDPQLEAILAVKPDVVVTVPNPGQERTLKQLVAHGIPVLEVNVDTLKAVENAVAALGVTLDKGKAAEDWLKRHRQDIRSLTRSQHPLRVLVVVGQRPLVLAGQNTYVADALAAIGHTLVAPAGATWPTASLEYVLTAKADVVLVAEGPEAAARLRSAIATQSDVVVVAGRTDLLMRPGPSVTGDLTVLASLLSARATP